ncbi:metal-sensitive transcriptional regulator [Nocardioides sp. LML1-1-1.1]|uniref:metal-sensitive transcriptional regulator n=1 Tax=Nocardioides sp. LML1-1-1.1 TaxID=3135248 RepID=UPI0034499684
MQLETESMKPVVNRIKRAQGQLAGVVRMLEEGRDCEEVVTQLAAVSKALDRAGFAIVAAGLQQCIVEGGPDSLDTKKMEKIFLTLA